MLFLVSRKYQATQITSNMQIAELPTFLKG